MFAISLKSLNENEILWQLIICQYISTSFFHVRLIRFFDFACFASEFYLYSPLHCVKESKYSDNDLWKWNYQFCLAFAKITN